MGVRPGNGFPDTRGHPVNTDLDLVGFPFALCPPLLGISLVMGGDWLRCFWLPARWDSCSLFGCRPRSTLRGVISGRGAHLFSSWGTGVQCPSQSNADVLPEVACPVDVG